MKFKSKTQTYIPWFISTEDERGKPTLKEDMAQVFYVHQGHEAHTTIPLYTFQSVQDSETSPTSLKFASINDYGFIPVHVIHQKTPFKSICHLALNIPFYTCIFYPFLIAKTFPLCSLELSVIWIRCYVTQSFV